MHWAYLIEPKKGSNGDALYQAWQFCKKQSKSVEVFYRNMDGDKVLTRVHFPFNPDVSSSIVASGTEVCFCRGVLGWEFDMSSTNGTYSYFFQHELREEVIEKIKWNISHDSAEDKLRDLLEWMKAVKEYTIHRVSLIKYLSITFESCYRIL